MSESITAGVPIDGSGKPAAAPAVSPPPAPVVPANEAPQSPPAPAAGDPPAAPANPADLTKSPVAEKPLGDTKSEAQQAAETATGLDLTPFTEEFHANGKLSEDSYKALEAKGFSRATTDTYIRGVQAEVTGRLTSLAETVGGVENYNAILSWGKTGLSDAEKAEAVKMLSGTNVDTAKTYLAGLQARFTKANGSTPSVIAGGGGAPTADVFETRADQAAAMRDPRYKSDAKYRQGVIDKSVRSFTAKDAKKRAKKPAARRRTKTTTRRARSKGSR